MRFGQLSSVGLGLILFQLLASHAALAATQTLTLTTSINVVQTCAINASAMNFGNVTKVLGTETATSTVAVTCSAGTPYSVSFRAGSVLTSGFGNLAGPGGNVQVFVSLATTAGTGTGSHVMNGKLTASAITTQGLYQNNFLIYVNY